MAKPVQIKSPFFALFLSALFPGLGQLYNGRTASGILYILIAPISIPLSFIFIGFVTYAVVWLVAVITAYTGALKVNNLITAQLQQQKQEKVD